MSRNTSVPSRVNPERTRISAAPANRLECLLERQHEPDGPPEPKRHERDQRLVLGMLLPAEPAARIGGNDPHLRERQAHEVGNDPLEPVRVLDRAPDHDPAARRGHERVRLDGELGDHREGVCALDHDVGFAFGRLEVAPRIAVLAEHVRAREGSRSAGATDPGRAAHRCPAAATVWTAGLLDVDLNEARGLLGRVERLGGDGGNRVPMELRLADREHGPVPQLRAGGAASGPGDPRRS